MNDEIFISRLLFLSNKEKLKGLNGESNIVKFYNVKDLPNILNKENKKTYYEHYTNRKPYLRLAIDYDKVINLRTLKKIFITDFYKFLVSQNINLSLGNIKNRIAISKSKYGFHIVYPNIIMSLNEIIYLMKVKYKEYIKNKDYTIDFSIYKKNFNLRMVYSQKHDSDDGQLIPIVNDNLLDHIITYYT